MLSLRLATAVKNPFAKNPFRMDLGERRLRTECVNILEEHCADEIPRNYHEPQRHV